MLQFVILFCIKASKYSFYSKLLKHRSLNKQMALNVEQRNVWRKKSFFNNIALNRPNLYFSR